MHPPIVHIWLSACHERENALAAATITIGVLVARSILLAVLGLVVAVANIAFWMFVVIRGHERFQRWVERKYDVVIEMGHKGHWRVSGGSWPKRLAIEFLQLGYFLTAFLVWAAAMLLVLGLFSLAGP
jgi:hypothetical protein